MFSLLFSFSPEGLLVFPKTLLLVSTLLGVVCTWASAWFWAKKTVPKNIDATPNENFLIEKRWRALNNSFI